MGQTAGSKELKHYTDHGAPTLWSSNGHLIIPVSSVSPTSLSPPHRQATYWRWPTRQSLRTWRNQCNSWTCHKGTTLMSLSASLEPQWNFCGLSGRIRSALSGIEPSCFSSKSLFARLRKLRWSTTVSRFLLLGIRNLLIWLSSSARFFNLKSSRPEYAVHITASFAAVILYTIFNASRAACNLVLFCMETVVDTVHLFPGVVGERWTRHIPPLPKDLETALNKFDLSPVVQHFAQCSACGKLFSFDGDGCPETCDNTNIEGQVCSQKLKVRVRVQGRMMEKPLKTFVYQSPTQWLGRMISRPGFEAAMDSIPRTASVKEVAKDIWDAKGIHEVKWKDGKSYADLPKDQLRIVLTMAIDWFNAYHSPEAKKKWSVGAIYMVILNLPAAIRYRPENICLVGIIPGPKKPSMEQMNHFLKPIVDEMFPFWNHGKWFSRTPEYEQGRLVWALILLLICDLDASRAIAGFTSFSHEYFCHCCMQQIDNIANFDKTTWTARVGTTHKERGQQWLNAKTASQRSAITDRYGVRYSVLHSLPYHDPVRHTVIEPAHEVMLGNLKRHCRHIFKMDVQVTGGDGSNFLMPNPPPKADLAYGRELFLAGTTLPGKPKSLAKLSRAVLYALCVEYKVFKHVDGRHVVKANLVDGLVKYVSFPSSWSISHLTHSLLRVSES